jgi:hypothetical protein
MVPYWQAWWKDYRSITRKQVHPKQLPTLLRPISRILAERTAHKLGEARRILM